MLCVYVCMWFIFFYFFKKIFVSVLQGLCAYLLMCIPDAARRGVVVGFDTRGQPESGCSSQW